MSARDGSIHGYDTEHGGSRTDSKRRKRAGKWGSAKRSSIQTPTGPTDELTTEKDLGGGHGERTCHEPTNQEALTGTNERQSAKLQYNRRIAKAHMLNGVSAARQNRDNASAVSTSLLPTLTQPANRSFSGPPVATNRQTTGDDSVCTQ